MIRPEAAEEVADELAFHVEMRTRELEARGWPREAARAEALKGFGDIERVRRACESLGRRRERRRDVATRLADIAGDARFAVRQLRRSPAFTVAAVLTLALGIGGTTAVWSVIDAVVLRPLAFEDPDRAVQVAELVEDRMGDVSAGNFVDWQETSRSFAHMSALRWASFNLAAEGAPERVLGLTVSHGYFDVFGVPPLLGRTFLPEEDVPGAETVVVLSHALWEERFEADPDVVGQQVRLNGRPYTVVGVMPAMFDPMATRERLWVPIAFTAERRRQHDEHFLTVVARLAPGVTLEQANTELAGIADVLRERYPRANATRSARVVPLEQSVVGGALRARLWVLLGAVGLVLLIACGNVANLMLARGAARMREMGVRAAIGAGRGRLARQLLTESVVLALGAALAGVVLAFLGVRALVAAAPPGVPRLAEAGVHAGVLLFALAVSVASGLLFGLAPAFRVARGDLFGVLRDGGRGTTGERHDRLRGAFVAAEVALAFTLLTGAGLLIRSALQLAREDPGFESAGVLSARVSLAEAEPEAARRAFLTYAEQLRDVPGIAASALSSQVPAGPGGGSNGLLPEGRPMTPDQAITTRLRIVTPGYFETLGIALERGRDFTDADRAGGERVMIISRRMAELAWPGEDPIGRRVVCCEGAPEDPRWKTVVGVAADVQWRGPGVDYMPEFYLPLTQTPPESFTWIQSTMTVVARGPTGAVAEGLRTALRSVVPDAPLFDVRPMDARVRDTWSTNRFAAQLLGVLGAVALLLSVVGIYGVVAYQAGRRTHEIGLRMALGASSGDVLRLVTRQGLVPVLAGLAIGIPAALAAARVVRGVLFGVSATDPATFAGAIIVLVAAGAFAAFLPARRATRVHPGRVLTRG